MQLRCVVYKCDCLAVDLSVNCICLLRAEGFSCDAPSCHGNDPSLISHIFFSQFHPEKIQFEWNPAEVIPHWFDAVHANLWPGLVFVNQTRLNSAYLREGGGY